VTSWTTTETSTLVITLSQALYAAQPSLIQGPDDLLHMPMGRQRLDVSADRRNQPFRPTTFAPEPGT